MLYGKVGSMSSVLNPHMGVLNGLVATRTAQVTYVSQDIVMMRAHLLAVNSFGNLIQSFVFCNAAVFYSIQRPIVCSATYLLRGRWADPMTGFCTSSNTQRYSPSHCCGTQEFLPTIRCFAFAAAALCLVLVSKFEILSPVLKLF